MGGCRSLRLAAAPEVVGAHHSKGTSMKTKFRAFMASYVVASVALMGTLGSARAADDKWFVLGEQTIKSTDPSATITSEGNRRDKNVKQVKLSVEGADVQITNVVLHWDNRRDDTLKDVGVVKSGGQTAAKDAPGMKSRLSSVSVQYKILGGASTANVKVLGFD